MGKTLDMMPDVLTAKDISEHIGLSRYTVYELMKLPQDRGGIPNIKVGKSKRVLKSEYEKWMNRKQMEQEQKSDRRMKRIEGTA